MLFLITSLILTAKLTGSQTPDGYDTLFTRGSNYKLVPKYDTIAQLQEANLKADSILCNLKQIARFINLNDTTK